MPLDEGVIKYKLIYEDGPSPDASQVEEINNWRMLLHQMELIGQDPERYDGFGFGNISCRVSENNKFLVSGTQTGHFHRLSPEHYCLVTHCDAMANKLVAKGPMKPSSEAITHGAIYQYSPATNVIIHVHSPDIWRCYKMLHLPHTSEDTQYGTPELAGEIKKLFEKNSFEKVQMIVVPGHEDGVIAFGSTAERAGHEIIRVLASAIQHFK